MLPGVVLRMARLVRQGTGPQSTETPAVREAARKPPVKTLVVPAVDLVQLIAKASSSSKLLPPSLPPTSLPTLQFFPPPELTPYAALSPPKLTLPNLFPKLSLFTVSSYDGSVGGHGASLKGHSLIPSLIYPRCHSLPPSSHTGPASVRIGSAHSPLPLPSLLSPPPFSPPPFTPLPLPSLAHSQDVPLFGSDLLASSLTANGEIRTDSSIGSMLNNARSSWGGAGGGAGGEGRELQRWAPEGGEEGMGLDEDNYRSSSRWDGGEGRQIVEGKG
ncbi:unnamed protein product [Closterium sp. NIES-53]